MPRTWRAGGIIGPTTAKQNAGAGGARETDKTRREEAGVIDKSAGRVEVWSLESLCELEKQTKLLIKLPAELLVILVKKLER